MFPWHLLWCTTRRVALVHPGAPAWSVVEALYLHEAVVTVRYQLTQKLRCKMCAGCQLQVVHQEAARVGRFAMRAWPAKACQPCLPAKRGPP